MNKEKICNFCYEVLDYNSYIYINNIKEKTIMEYNKKLIKWLKIENIFNIKNTELFKDIENIKAFHYWWGKEEMINDILSLIIKGEFN